jgi:3-deoxy-D-manno-octulosonic-acid transferase
MYALYSAALALGLMVYLPVFALRRLRRPDYRRGFAQRWGRYSPGLPPEPRCWIHAVSVGETAAAVPLVEGLRRRWPELGIVVTTVTPTGARIVADRLGAVATHRYFPLDLPGAVQRALDGVRPRFFIGMETELWPNFLRALGRRGIPCMIANGRISDRSYRRYRLVRPLMARVLDHITVFAMQSDEDARRIIALGAPPERVVVTGNLKTDLRPEDEGGDSIRGRLLGLDPAEEVWVAGSTHRGEEGVVLDAFVRLKPRFPRLALLLAPRHPERVEEVERLVRDRGLASTRRSELPRARVPGAVIVLDTVGELAEFYRLAEVVYVGGSLVPVGGHNLMEPALRRKPVLVGPHTSNFRESAELLQSAGGAVVVKDGPELERELARLLEDPELRRRMGEAGFAAVAGRQGAVGRTLELVERCLLGAPSRDGGE